MSNPKTKHNNGLLTLVEGSLFLSRWLLLIPYLGLSIGLGIYCWKFALELWEMVIHVQTLTTETTMLGILGLVDIAMVANLVIMVNVGGYSIFIREINPDDVTHKPRFMNHITAGGLKTKMATSLIGVSSIHLLKKFIEAASIDRSHQVAWSGLAMLLVIHGLFIVSAIALAFVDKIGHGPHTDPSQDKHL